VAAAAGQVVVGAAVRLRLSRRIDVVAGAEFASYSSTTGAKDSPRTAMTKLKATPLVIPPVAFISRGAEEDQAIIHPDQIFRCLKEPAAPGLTVITHIDPY